MATTTPPNSPPTPKPRRQRPNRETANAARAYHTRSPKRQSSLPASALDTLPLTVEAELTRLLVDGTPPADDRDDYPFSQRQALLLQAYIRWPGDPIAQAVELCQSVGYHPSSLDSAQSLLLYISQRIEAMDDIKRAMRLFGMGVMPWARKISEIANCGAPRVEVLAAKLWGLAMGVFDDPAPSAGAKVIIESAVETPDGARTATRVTLDPTSAPTSGDLVFTAAKPKVAQKRRKMLNKTE